MSEFGDQEYRAKLLMQIREAYGRVVYTYTCYLKMMNRLQCKNNRARVVQIILSAITTAGLLGVIIVNQKWLAITSGIFSAMLLGVNLYMKDFRLAEDSNQYRLASDKLWMIREDYVSLLTDFNILSVEEITRRRNDLQSKVYDIYSTYPKTDKKSYKDAQIALKSEEEQFFTKEELNKMLPQQVRTEDDNKQ